MSGRTKKLMKEKSKSSADEFTIIANRYRVSNKLGSGSYGTVYLISDLKVENCQKVLKKIHIGDLEPDETISAVSEARLLSKLDHPGIVKFHDSFIDREFFCIITEFCEGGDLDVKLHTWKKNNKVVDKSLVLTWFVQLILAVQYIHRRRVLHRDLKTRNIFVKSNMVKIGDFGISRILEGSTDIATTFTGTPYFMAPEILKHEGYNSKSDIWSAGVILYEMCTLKKAFQGSSLMAVMSNIVEGDVPTLPSRFNSELNSIFLNMLCKDPRKRISASEILRKPYILQHLEKMKVKMSGDRTIDRKLANQEALEIAHALSGEKCSKSKFPPQNKYPMSAMNAKKRPLTPKELMKIRKQQRADEEMDRLKKLTVQTYNESRRRCTDIKKRNEHSSTDEVDGNMNKNDIHFNIIDETKEDKDNDLDVFKLAEPGDVMENMNEGVHHAYTHCFGDDIEETQQHVMYTHCFGEGSSSEDENNDDAIDDVFERDEDKKSSHTNDLTMVSSIPEDADSANTYYSTYDDFEEDVTDDDDGGGGSNITSDSDLTESDVEEKEEEEEEEDEEGLKTDDYEALVDCMENALVLQAKDEDAESTFGDTRSITDATSIRQEKIEKLTKECINLLGEDGFHKAYDFLHEVRFKANKKMSEEAIMKRLRKLVGTSRDCFLVEQLLFLKKQNQIYKETF